MIMHTYFHDVHNLNNIYIFTRIGATFEAEKKVATLLSVNY